MYADLEIANTQSADKATTQTVRYSTRRDYVSDNDHIITPLQSDNMNTTEVQYSHIKNGQSV